MNSGGRNEIIIDAGIIAAYLNDRDQYHGWVVDRMADLVTPFFSCEAVLSETHYLLRRANAESELFSLLERRLINVSFSYESHLERVSDLLRTYANVPMAFADACLVAMYERRHAGTILTTDSDFQIYRDEIGAPLDLILP